MKVIILSAVAVLVLGAAAAFVLDRTQEPAFEVYVGSGARVGEPGHNLVGPRWDGLNVPGEKKT